MSARRSMWEMVRSAPRIDVRLADAIRKLDDPTVPIAETCRRVGKVARELGLARPSYEQVRLRVHELRERDGRPSMGDILVDVAFNLRPPTAIMEQALDTLPEGRRR